MGDASRALRMIGVAGRYHPTEELRYVGVDLFEARTAKAGPRVSLKDAHCLLRGTGIRCHLVPGDPLQALARSANSLPGNELVLISAADDAESLERAWFYLPRMLAPDAAGLCRQPSRRCSEIGWNELAANVAGRNPIAG